MDLPTTSAPLLGWTFDGTLRTYQTEVLERIPVGTVGPLHVVAPPGSGKTLLGLLLATREGDRALVLAPTVTIRQQWVRTAESLAPTPASVSDDPERISDLTVMTYQLLSVTGDGSPFDDLARAVWAEELIATGRTEADAATWLAELAVDSPAAYRSGIRSRVRRLRRRFARRNPDELARVLHPNAVALIDRLVDAGVRTVILDECHHLLDHWALVVAYLAGRIRERGGSPRLIGLTATLPSPDDEAEYENYTQLLGEVDYEVPTPAVVKEGHLAPYRDHVMVIEPTPAEISFIRHHEERLHDLVMQLLTTPDAVSYLERQLQPEDEDEDEPGAGAEALLERAFAKDFPLTRSCAVVLRVVQPQHPLLAAIPPLLLDRCTSEDLLTVLTRFAQTRLLGNPDAHRQWDYVRRALADFGYMLTDRGLRRGRDPLDTTLAYSAAKDHAAVEILRLELESEDADRVRAVVVTDFVEHGNSRGMIGDAAAGALRAFELLAADPVTVRLNPVLVTAQHLRASAGDAADLAAELTDLLAEPVLVREGSGPTRELRGPGIGSGRMVAALSELIRRGRVRLLVGTRGLLGEGWDCPAVNTLIDLTAVATSSATQQLRGRTLRLDPEWPDKVAHNWSVACLIPSQVDLDDTTEPRRLRRKHSHLWGPSADGDGSIVSGLGHALPPSAMQALDRVLDKDPAASVADVEAFLAESRPTRTQTRRQWRIGEPYLSHERESVRIQRVPHAPLLHTARAAGAGSIGAFITGTAITGGLVALVDVLGALSIPLVGGLALALLCGVGAAVAAAVPALGRALRDRRRPAEVYRNAAVAIARTLHEAGRISPIDESTIRALRQDGDRVRIEVGGEQRDRAMVADAVEELFGPVRTPRFLLQTGRAESGRVRLSERIADRLSPGRTLLPIPRAIARRRADAELLHRHWQRLIGPCALHELQGAAGLALLRVARSSEGRLDGTESRTRIWG